MIWTDADQLTIRQHGTNLNEIWIIKQIPVRGNEFEKNCLHNVGHFVYVQYTKLLTDRKFQSLSTYDQFKCFQMITFCLFCHQMPCCWLWTINRFLSFMKTLSNNVSHLSAQMCWQIQMYLYFLETIHHKINILPKTDRSYFQARGRLLCHSLSTVSDCESTRKQIMPSPKNDRLLGASTSKHVTTI